MEDKDIQAIVVRLRKLESKGRDVKNEVEGIRALLREEFDARGTNVLSAGRYHIRRVTYEREQFDMKRYRENHPSQYKRYTIPQTVSKIEIVG